MSKENNSMDIQITKFEDSAEQRDNLSTEKHNINQNVIGPREFNGVPKKLDFSVEQIGQKHNLSFDAIDLIVDIKKNSSVIVGYPILQNQKQNLQRHSQTIRSSRLQAGNGLEYKCSVPRNSSPKMEKTQSFIIDNLQKGVAGGGQKFKNQISVFAKNSKSVRILLNTSKGRDKFSQFLQYGSNFYLTCMYNSQKYGKDARDGKIASLKKVIKFESNISNGRKIFRLLLWLNEIDGMHEILNNTKLQIEVKVLKFISSICSFIYYFSDNCVWFAKLGFIGGNVPFMETIFGRVLKWARVKDRFSLWKSMIELFIFSYIYRIKKREDREMVDKLDQFEDQLIRRNKKCYVYLRKLVIHRREMRYIRIEIIIYILRLILLTKGLQLRGHYYLDPVFVSGCALAMSIIVIFKSMRSKKNFYKLEAEDLQNTENQKNQVILSDREILKMGGQSNKMISQERQNVVNLDLIQIKKAKSEQKALVPNGVLTSEDEAINYVSPPSPYIVTNIYGKKTCLGIPPVTSRKLSVIPENQDEDENNPTPKKKLSGNKPKAKPTQKCDDVFKKLEQQGQIDDVYDANCVLEGYKLFTLRDNFVLNPTCISEMQQDKFCYDFQKKDKSPQEKLHAMQRQISKKGQYGCGPNSN